MKDKLIKDLFEKIANIASETKTEDLSEELRTFGSPLQLAAWSERNFELNLREDYKRKTTFMSDFSIAEWYSKSALVDTLKRAVSEWKDNIEYMAEMILVLNSKSWEMDSRLHDGWCRLYSELYYAFKDFYFDYFKGNDEAMQYYYDYID